ncbi:UNVERIFIED_CONTAM: hypothetical protein PYX00_009304 [Menopon gallinae]|uniref:Protein FAM76A n=1 Tax=Menopon gallinae TaxID=328185 RepID=A0AAW2HAW3_9NEOP
MSNTNALFACSQCFTRHPFEELSPGQQLCKECRGAFPVVKCTYCRSEFQQTSKGNTSTICKKCEANVKQFGKPTACEYCNIIAAFIGNKCQRCTNCEKKYGPPVTCEQCKQKCAFDRHDDDKKQVDGKLLCWLCTLSYKRALAKTKQTDAERRAHLKRVASRSKKEPKPERVDVTKMPPQSDKDDPLPTKIPRVDQVDPNSSDHVVATTQLKEKIASLQKQLSAKDAQLLAKDRQITELKAKNFTSETEMRNKMKLMEKEANDKIESLTSKVKSLQKELATLSKSTGNKKLLSLAKEKAEANSGSGTDSPSIN